MLNNSESYTKVWSVNRQLEALFTLVSANNEAQFKARLKPVRRFNHQSKLLHQYNKIPKLKLSNHKYYTNARTFSNTALKKTTKLHNKI